MDIKQRSQGIEPSIEPRNIIHLVGDTDNIYEALVVMSRRAGQISLQMRQELHAKLEEFASTTENLEEIHENKEQIEISKFYERLPNPAILAMNEFLTDKIFWKYKEKDERKF